MCSCFVIVVYISLLAFFFFKQKTAYEMRISDWSSDVCSSDLPNTLVQLETGSRTEPNLKATEIELYDGLQARSVNAWPSARFDLLSSFRYFKVLMPSGFYYKTFLAPTWHWYERSIRSSSGLRRSPRPADPHSSDQPSPTRTG